MQETGKYNDSPDEPSSAESVRQSCGRTVTLSEFDKSALNVAIKQLSKALNLVEAAADRIEFLCDHHDWDPSVVDQMKDGAGKLGFALATIVRFEEDD